MSDDLIGPNGLCQTTNVTVIDGFNITCDLYQNIETKCRVETCPLSLAQYDYVPNLAGNILYSAFFVLFLIAHLFFGIRYRTWGFLAGMVIGLLLEVLGWVARVLLHFFPFDGSWFKFYLIGVTIAPAFLCISIYLCLARIIVIYGRNLSRFRPGFYTITFIGFDFFSLVLQAIGGALAAIASTPSMGDTGVHIMVAGLSIQVASLFVYIILCSDFAFNVYRHRFSLDSTHAVARQSSKFKAFLIALATATILIFVRSIFRVAELQEGFDSKLANDEVALMILEGAMMVLAVGALTVTHPGITLGDTWHKATFAIRPGRDRGLARNVASTSSEEHELKE